MPRVHSLAFRVLGDHGEAEDVTQEAMLRLWRTAPDWRPGEARISTWLYRVASNLCTDRLRRNRRRQTGPERVEAEEIRDDKPGVEERLMKAERAAALRAALAELPARCRIAVSLRHLQQLSNPEIAEIMDTSVEAVESLTARAKRMLAARLLDRREDLGLD